jgi:ABC-type Zn uptake system ZnuABC Zn-binding protein ZnuA
VIAIEKQGRPRQRARSRRALITVALLACTSFCTATGVLAEPVDRALEVFTTVPDLADLAARVGGDQVETFSMVSGREDAHFAEPRPSFVKRLAKADVFITVGMELEAGYEPALRRNARNPRIAAGRPGYIVAGSAVQALEVPRSGAVTRAMGDVHVQGSPHFNVDPLSGLRVADLIRARLSELRPASASYFASNYEGLRRLVSERLVGEELSKKYDAIKLALLFQRGQLVEFLEGQGDRARLGGWLGRMAPHHGTRVVDDHRMWPYFARTFGIVIAADMEPRPGSPPTTRHLQSVIETMKAEDIRVIIKSAYYDTRHARFVADATNARTATLAHQVGAVDGANTWIDMIDHNVEALAKAIEGSRP